MTFALAAGNADQIIQVSDRRLTAWTGSVMTEAYGKGGHLLCDDASALYCFTGLAASRGFDTATWLMEALQAASVRDARFRELIEHFAEIATQRFLSDPDLLSAPVQHRWLTVMLTAYGANDTIYMVLISNFQDFINDIDHPEAQTKFTVYCESNAIPLSENPTLIQRVGAYSAMTATDEAELRFLLQERKPANAIRSKAVSIVDSIAGRHRAGGTVGRRLSFARIDRAAPHVPVVGYESDIVEHGMPMLSMVDARSNGLGLLIGEPRLSADGPVVFPNVHRNAPCPCGSGKKFRFCHRLPRPS